jgi:hypothetical protein
MATAEYREKRITVAKNARAKALERKSKGETSIKEADETIARLDKTLEWLANMPVSDKGGVPENEEPDEVKPDVSQEASDAAHEARGPH